MTDCADKTGRYKTGAAARKALADIRRRPFDKRESKPVAVYPCTRCGYFHLTSSPR